MLLINLMNKIILFLLVTIVSVALIVVYNMAGTKSESSGTLFNFDPLPTVSPADLPDSAMRGETPQCLVTPTECNANSECEPCADNGNVTCSDPTNNVRYELPSGAEIPMDGKSYCIPTAATNMPCNRYTGKYVWTDSAELGQEWKCECLYPDLFNNPQTGCTEQKACVNSINRDVSNTMPKNKYKLVEASTINSDGPLKVWDPLDPEATDTLKKNPYSADEDGNPNFVCACGINEDGSRDETTVPPYLRLPGDPYNCHVDSCDELQGYQNHTMTDEDGNPGCYNGVCNCAGGGLGKLCNGSNEFVIQIGDKKEKCYSISDSCNEIDRAHEIDKTDYEQCDCGGDGAYSRMCVSDYVSASQIENAGLKDNLETCTKDSDCLHSSCDASGFCRCQNPLNPIGSECVSACYPNNPCQNNTYCIASGGREFACDCTKNPDGTPKDETTFEVELKDCDDKPIKAEWTNKDGGKLCNDLTVVPGTTVYKSKRNCFFGIVPEEETEDACILLKGGLSGQCSGKDKAECKATSICRWTDLGGGICSVDIPSNEFTGNFGGGFECPNGVSYQEGKCGFFGFKPVTSTATCN